jgi:hypothetical protein
MKDTYVILKEEYQEDGSAEIVINTNLGSFSATTKPDEIDAKYPSKYHASEICLAKALRKFAEATVNALKRDIKLLEGLVKQATDMAMDKYDIDNSSFRIINGTLKQKRKDLKLWQTRVENLSESIKIRVSVRDQLVAKYQTKEKSALDENN